jgi:hypothetical protein
MSGSIPPTVGDQSQSISIKLLHPFISVKDMISLWNVKVLTNYRLK